MAASKLVCLPGDGVGPELIAEARRVLQALRDAGGPAVETLDKPIGASGHRTSGSTLPDETLQAIKEHGTALFGGIDMVHCPPPSPMGQMRRKLELYCEVREMVTLGDPGGRPPVDLVLMRDLCEGFLPDRNMWKGSGEFMPTPDVAMSMRVVTRAGIERLTRFALDYMKSHGRKRVTLVHKVALFQLTDGLFLETARGVLAGAPVKVDDMLVDDCAGILAEDPSRLDCILTTNFLGDILADVAAVAVGGLVAVANYGPAAALFRPTQEALPALVGKNTVNPVPMFIALSLALGHMGHDQAAAALDGAIRDTVARTGARSAELAKGSTTDVTGVLCGSLKERWTRGSDHH